MAVVRVRINPDNINQIVIDTEDNSPAPFVEKVTHARFTLADTNSWQEFLLTVPDATRAFKVGDVVDLDLDPIATNYAIRLGNTWFKISNGASQGNDAAIRAAGYVFTGNIGTLRP